MRAVPKDFVVFSNQNASVMRYVCKEDGSWDQMVRVDGDWQFRDNVWFDTAASDFWCCHNQIFSSVVRNCPCG